MKNIGRKYSKQELTQKNMALLPTFTTLGDSNKKVKLFKSKE